MWFSNGYRKELADANRDACNFPHIQETIDLRTDIRMKTQDLATLVCPQVEYVASDWDPWS